MPDKDISNEAASDYDNAGDKPQAYTPPSGYYIFDSLSLDLNRDGNTDRLLMLEPVGVKGVANGAHFNTRVVLLNGSPERGLAVWAESKKEFLGAAGDCPADGYQRAVAKGAYFTIEQTVCDGYVYVHQYVTFRYDKASGEVVLHKYGETFTDRTNPDKKIPARTQQASAASPVRFEDWSDEVAINFRQQ